MIEEQEQDREWKRVILSYFGARGAELIRDDPRMFEYFKRSIKTGSSPLQTCVAYMDTENHSNMVILVTDILEINSDIGSRNKYGETAFHWACHKGSVEIVDLLMEIGCADLADVDNDGNNALHWCASSMSHDVLEKLMKSLVGPDRGIIDAANCKGETPLMTAIYNGNFEAVKIIVGNGARICGAIECAKEANEGRILRYLTKERIKYKTLPHLRTAQRRQRQSSESLPVGGLRDSYFKIASTGGNRKRRRPYSMQNIIGWLVTNAIPL